jgi:hypothetical protein
MKTETTERSPNETLADALIEAAAIVRRLPHTIHPYWSSTVWLFTIETFDKSELPALVKAIGGKIAKDKTPGYIILTRELSPYLKLCVGVAHEKVCTKVEREVVVKERVPVGEVRYEERDVVKNITEWICPESLLDVDVEAIARRHAAEQYHRAVAEYHEQRDKTEEAL